MTTFVRYSQLSQKGNENIPGDNERYVNKNIIKITKFDNN